MMAFTTKEATFSHDRVFRYTLHRIWNDNPNKKLVGFIMLNPSTADENVLDPTLTRCQDYAKVWEFDGMVIGNLFAFRSTDPLGLLNIPDPVGVENDEYLAKIRDEVRITIFGWGSNAKLRRLVMARIPKIWDIWYGGEAIRPEKK